MTSILSPLLDLQARIHQFQAETLDMDPTIDNEYLAKVEFSLSDGLLDVRFHGDSYDEFPQQPADITDDEANFPLAAFLTWLSLPEHAQRIRSLRFSAPDEGANGIKAWDFSRLLATDVAFPALRHFEVGLTDGGDHNTSIISSQQDFYSEAGTIAALLIRMPALAALILPSAPNRNFTEGPRHGLSRLRIQCGMSHEGFIGNLAASSRFCELATLDYTENPGSAMMDGAEDYERGASFEDFQALVDSPAGRRLSRLILRGTCLTATELQALADLNPALQILHIPLEAARYI